MAMAMNPWDGPSLGLELGDPAQVLTLGWKHSLISSSLQDEEEKLENEVRESSSIKLIQVLEEISSITSEINQLEVEICGHKLDRLTSDFTHCDQLEHRLSRTDSLLAHMTHIAQGKHAVLTQLQAKAAKNSLNIAASCQKHAHQVLNGLAPSIQHFSTHSAMLDWSSGRCDKSKTLSKSHDQVGRSCDQVQEALVRCQTMYHTLDELHKTQQQQ